jgi:diphthine synthase
MKRLSMIGMGTSDERSMPLKGYDLLKEADAIYAEFFTSILREGAIDRLERMLKKRIAILDRKELEEDEVIMKAFERHDHVCFLTAGDPLTATTHQELRFDARDRGIDVEVVHSASIFNVAAGIAGLQHYKFGRTTTLAYPEEGYFPTSPLDFIMENLERGLHTLVLLDIQADRERYMTVPEACELLLRLEGKRGGGMINYKTDVVAILRAGMDDERILYGPIGELKEMDTGGPPQCLIIPGILHFAEEEALQHFRL